MAVSGGVDSMVMLHLLARLSRRHGWRLAVAHFNHQLRGRSSDADERFVAQAAAALGLECHVGCGDVRALARRQRLSIEQAARSLRHRFLARMAKRFHFPTIALAHHADDQVELFFLRLFRGAGGEGLAGMKWRNPSPEDPTVELVRPLLALSKADLERLARRAKIAFREDASNRSTDILRNRIRHRLLPQLQREYQPAIASVVARMMDLAGAEAELVAATAQRWLARKAVSGFERLPVAVQRCCLKEQLVRAKLTPAFATIEALRREAGVAVAISPELAVARDAGGRLKLNSEVRGARPPRASLAAPSRPAFSAHDRFHASAQFSATDVFREGAENCARGGRAPLCISEFGFKLVRCKITLWFFNTWLAAEPLSKAPQRTHGPLRGAGVMIYVAAYCGG